MMGNGILFTEEDHYGEGVSNMTFDLSQTDRLLSTTRAVRKRLDLERPVEREVLLECLRLAVQAPTASNSQTWRWLIVTDPAKRALIADSYRAAGQAYLDAARKREDDPQTRRVYESAFALSQVLQAVPALVIPCIEGSLEGVPQAVAAGMYASIIPAAWSFQLALRSRGLGSTWTTLHLFHADVVAEALGIPEGFTQIALLPVAYTIGTDFKPAARPPVEDITYWDTWGDTQPEQDPASPSHLDKEP
jgi:nitroreductase